MLAATAARLGGALAVPGAFGDDALLFGGDFLIVRVMHVVIYAIVAWGDRANLSALFRLAPAELVGAYRQKCHEIAANGYEGFAIDPAEPAH